VARIGAQAVAATASTLGWMDFMAWHPGRQPTSIDLTACIEMVYIGAASYGTKADNQMPDELINDTGN